MHQCNPKKEENMLIELWRKVMATDYSSACCAICGNDLDRGSVFAVARTDDGGDMGEICPVCLDYLNRRKDDPEDPTLGNWPAREWPSLEDLKEARRRCPKPMFADEAAFNAAIGGDTDKEDELLQSSFIWRMEPEVAGR